MDAIDLLKKMEGACKTKCNCWLSIDSEDNLLLRWSGDIKVNKDGDKKEWGVEVKITPHQLCHSHHLDRRLEDIERSIALLLKQIAEGVQV